MMADFAIYWSSSHQTTPVNDDKVATSPVHAAQRLSMLPTATNAGWGGGQSTSAPRNHFARFVIIDDVAYVAARGATCFWEASRATSWWSRSRRII